MRTVCAALLRRHVSRSRRRQLRDALRGRARCREKGLRVVTAPASPMVCSRLSGSGARTGGHIPAPRATASRAGTGCAGAGGVISRWASTSALGLVHSAPVRFALLDSQHPHDIPASSKHHFGRRRDANAHVWKNSTSMRVPSLRFDAATPQRRSTSRGSRHTAQKRIRDSAALDLLTTSVLRFSRRHVLDEQVSPNGRNHDVSACVIGAGSCSAATAERSCTANGSTRAGSSGRCTSARATDGRNTPTS